MGTKKTWQDFRNAGLLLFVNQLLHIFGWAIVLEFDEETKGVTGCYPARVNWRGFSESATSEAYKKISQYMVDNASELKEEANL